MWDTDFGKGYAVIMAGSITSKFPLCSDLSFVHLKEEFEMLGKKYGNDVWLVDCVHPTPAGHKLIADRLEEAFLKIK